MSKLQAAGMEADAVLQSVTTNAARVLGLEDHFGSVQPGLTTDLAILEWDASPRALSDTSGQTRYAGCWVPRVTVRSGRILESA